MKTETNDLLKMLANAYTTYCECGGHNKAERNNAAVGEYKRELEKRNFPIPSEEKLLETGIFNGEGSY